MRIMLLNALPLLSPPIHKKKQATLQRNKLFDLQNTCTSAGNQWKFGDVAGGYITKCSPVKPILDRLLVS
jgi:hypothetical protein